MKIGGSDTLTDMLVSSPPTMFSWMLEETWYHGIILNNDGMASYRRYSLILSRLFFPQEKKHFCHDYFPPLKKRSTFVTTIFPPKKKKYFCHDYCPPQKEANFSACSLLFSKKNVASAAVGQTWNHSKEIREETLIQVERICALYMCTLCF